MAERDRKTSVDYQQLEQVYHSQQEVKSMLETTLENYGQRFFLKGEQTGIETGIKKGNKEGQLYALQIMLESRFGKLSSSQRLKLEQMTPKKRDTLFSQLWNVQSLEDVFSD